ncbi:cytochrome P450 [Mycena albidolilacea]|uniref:Cytochrome P450 n=1 Tax=Mycena albidolilacea TaxID=1033008 RepID=A0AAD7EP24_9AGAR|nr:cytochrome P450 [Mycena albidolilacea]
MESLLQSVLVPFLLFTLAVYSIYRCWTRISISDIPGPEPESFLLGNLPEFFQSQAGEAEFKWQARFGHVLRLNGILGTQRLLISDPKALHHIYHNGYNIVKQGFRTELTTLMTGPGLASASGETHRRQRRINSPAFGTGDARSYIPIFASYASLSAKWKEIVADSSGSLVVNTAPYFSRFFLDVIGEVAFDYQFGAIHNSDDPIAAAYASLAPKMLVSPSKKAIFIVALLEFLPPRLIGLFLSYAPFNRLKNTRRVSSMIAAVAKELVNEKAKALIAGKGKRDIMSLLVKANASANPRTNLSEREMLAQMQTIMGAGHETTANTMSWTLFELAQHPDVQVKLREEIRAAEQAIRNRGDTEFTYADFEAMPYTIAVMKETFRFHPVSYNTMREAARDEVLPLSKPLVTKSGKTITELPIRKNTIIVVSISGYNRNTDVFGKDAHVFDPERWLDGRVQVTTSLGVYGNLMTFGSGHRACIAEIWHSVYEYQTFLVELVKNFDFSMDPTLAAKVRREAAMVMVPTISGEVMKGSQMPITIRAFDTL